VQNGGNLKVEGSTIELGHYAGATGTLTFDGSGGSSPTLTFTGAQNQLNVGDQGTGNFNVLGGATITETSAVIIGNASEGIGNATVSAKKSSWTINGNLTVGESGTGTLTIDDGDTVTVQQGQQVTLGDMSGSHGTVILDGVGSNLTVSQADAGSGGGDALVIGNSGTGTLKVQDGASIVFKAQSVLGLQSTAVGQITIDGSSGGTASNAMFKSGLVVGSGATSHSGTTNGLLSVTGGGQATISQETDIGLDAGAKGEIDVSGTGSTLMFSNATAINVGAAGSATLNVSNGAAFLAPNLTVTVGQASTSGTANSPDKISIIGVGEAGSSQTQFTSGQLVLGESGFAQFNASQGALLTTGDVTLGQESGSVATAVLDTGAVWKISEDLNVGEMGQGTLTVQGGAQLQAQNLFVTSTNNLGGTATITGDSSTLKVTDIFLGSGSGENGSLKIQNGGQVTVSNIMFDDNSEASTLTVDGKGSSGNTPSTLTVNDLMLQDGTFTVSGGGLLTLKGSSFKISAGSSFNLNVTDAGSMFDASSSSFEIDGLASVSDKLQVANGGTLATGASTLMGPFATMNVTGNGSTWEIGAKQEANGTLTISNGGAIEVGAGAGVSVQGATVLNTFGVIAVNGSGATFSAPSVRSNSGSLFATEGDISIADSLSLSGGLLSGGAAYVGSNGSIEVGLTSPMAGVLHIGPSGLVTNSAIIHGNVVVDLGGSYVSAGGAVTGSLFIAGLNKLFDGPGIETVNGDYTQTSTGVLDIGVEGTVAGSPTGYSVLDVTGNATLGGTLELSYLNGFMPTVGETLDFLNVNGTTTGAFTAVTLDGIPTLTINDTLVNGVLTVTGVTRDYANPALAAELSPNQIAVGGALNSGANTAMGDFATVLTSINNLSSAQQVGAAYDQLSPQRLQIFRNIAFDNFAFASQQLDRHFANERDGMSGLDTSNFSYSDAALGSQLSQIKGRLLAWSPAPEPGLLSDSGSVLGTVMTTDPKDLTSTNASISDADRWNVFIQGNVVLADVDSSPDAAHANYTTGGVTAGADYRVSPNWTFGALFGYNHTDASLDEEGSNAKVDTYSPGIYAAYVDKGWYANGLVSYGYTSYSENRDIVFPGTNRTATGAPDGSQCSVDVDGGYDFHVGSLTVGPSAGLTYVHLDISSFSEGDAGSVGLNVGHESDDSLRSRIGFDARWATKYMRTKFTYHLDTSWQHEFMNNSQGISSAFETPGVSSFTVKGVAPDRDSALIDVGLDVDLAKNVDGYVDYQTEAGERDFFAQSVQAGLKIGF
jgi:T5SS/PEP-CTERM-associated repeat protein